MYTTAKLYKIYIQYIYIVRNIISNRIFVFDDDKEDFVNIHGRLWEYQYFFPSEKSNLTVVVSEKRIKASRCF